MKGRKEWRKKDGRVGGRTDGGKEGRKEKKTGRKVGRIGHLGGPVLTHGPHVWHPCCKRCELIFKLSFFFLSVNHFELQDVHERLIITIITINILIFISYGKTAGRCGRSKRSNCRSKSLRGGKIKRFENFLEMMTWRLEEVDMGGDGVQTVEGEEDVINMVWTYLKQIHLLHKASRSNQVLSGLDGCRRLLFSTKVFTGVREREISGDLEGASRRFLHISLKKL